MRVSKEGEHSADGYGKKLTIHKFVCALTVWAMCGELTPESALHEIQKAGGLRQAEKTAEGIIVQVLGQPNS